MRGFAAIGALALGATALSGCVAAALPIAAASAIGREKIAGRGGRTANQPVPQGTMTPAQTMAVPAGAPAEAPVPPGMQYLYGSAEARALDLQAYLAFDNYVLARASDRDVGHEVQSVVLQPGATLDNPNFVPCGNKPLAVVLDIDETAVYNLGFEADAAATGDAYNASRWDRWEKTGGNAVVPVPGVVDAVDIARRANVTVIFNSNRSAQNADATASMIASLGLGSVTHLKTLFLTGDFGSGSDKDSRRAAIARQYCVIAMVGDQLGDFSDLFNAKGLSVAQRRMLPSSPGIETLWGRGWFLLPNTVYGTGLKGGLNDVFPADKRWVDPGPGVPAPTQSPAN